MKCVAPLALGKNCSVNVALDYLKRAYPADAAGCTRMKNYVKFVGFAAFKVAIVSVMSGS